MEKLYVVLLAFSLLGGISCSQPVKKIDGPIILISTDLGDIKVKLYNETPLHRDNFLKLVKTGFYNGISFHRVIPQFMIQAGDARTRGDSLVLKTTGKDSVYTLPAEFRPGLFHKRGALAAARMGDDVNPQKASSGTQFYIVQGRIFTETSLDSVETFRLKGRKLPAAHREVYKTIGGAPHLDQNYTVFGEVVSGMEIVDKIAQKPTTGRPGGDKPLQDIKILNAKLVKRKRN